MVQYQPQSLGKATGNANHYWKLANRERQLSRPRDLRRSLEDAGYTVLRDDTRDRLLDLQSRAERGLLCYQNCDCHELKTFHKQRGVKRQIRGTNKKAKYIAALEHADDNATFRFMDSPAELRLKIYEFHVGAHEDEEAENFGTYPRVPPPITEASRFVRKEALPIFYRRHRMQIRFSGQAGVNFKIARPLADLMELEDGDVLARYSKFNFYTSLKTEQGRKCYFWWNVDLSAGGLEYKLIDKSPEASTKVSAVKDVLPRVEEDLRSIWKEVVSREGSSGMRKGDLYAFGMVLMQARQLVDLG